MSAWDPNLLSVLVQNNPKYAHPKCTTCLFSTARTSHWSETVQIIYHMQMMNKLGVCCWTPASQFALSADLKAVPGVDLPLEEAACALASC
jgi:hypothetical protein